MSDHLNEAREVMDGDWAESAKNLFEDLTPMEAMDKFQYLMRHGGVETTDADPQTQQLIRSMAKISDSDINTWANNVVPDHSPNVILFYNQQMKDYRNSFRELLESGSDKPTVQ